MDAPRSDISGTVYLLIRNTDLTFTSTILSHCSIEVALSGASKSLPAQFSSTWMERNADLAA